MKVNLTATQKGLILVLVPLVFQIVFVAILAGLISNTQRSWDRLEDSRETLLAIHDTEVEVFESIAQILDSENHPERSYVGEFERLEKSRQKIIRQLKSRRPWRSDVRQITQAFLGATPRIQKLCQTGRKVYGDPSILPRDRIKYVRNEFYALGLQLNEVDPQIFDLEKMVQAETPGELQQRWIIIALVFVGLFISLLVSVAVSVLFAKDFVERLIVIDKNARFLAMGRELPPALTGGDEIADLDRVLHDSSVVLNELQDQENAFLSSAADVIVSLDEKGKFQTVGYAASRIWGYSSEELLGRSIVSIVDPQTAEKTHRAISNTINSKQEYEIENIVNCRNGQAKDSLWTLAWSPADRSLQCVAHDITERRELERLRQRFVAMASHDLRAPLTSIASTFSLLESGARGPLPSAVSNDIAKMEKSVSRLMDLVNDLLDLEKLEAGKMVTQLHAVSALDVCLAAIEALETMSKGTGVSIVKPTNDALLKGDERRLVQVLINLVSNAVKFSSRNSIVTVSIQDSGETVDIIVCDEGPGIQDEDKQLIFERFQQSKAKSDKGIKSTGLGLAIVKAIVDAHNGHVFVEDNQPQGSKFIVRIPAYTGELE